MGDSGQVHDPTISKALRERGATCLYASFYEAAKPAAALRTTPYAISYLTTWNSGGPIPHKSRRETIYLVAPDDQYQVQEGGKMRCVTFDFQGLSGLEEMREETGCR